MNKIIMITGANAGIGKETARQLAQLNTTEKIYLACRNQSKAELAKRELEESTERHIFEILIMDTSDPDSVKNAVKRLSEAVDSVVLNAGGMGGKTPGKLTKDGVTTMTAVNLLGHVVLVNELIEAKKINHTVLFASSEAARGIKQTGMKQPNLKTSSVDEFISVFNGKAYGDKFDPMQVYGTVKYGGTLWMSSMARKYPQLRFISMSPGGTRGTEGMNDLPLIKKILFKYIGMPIFMPLMGLSHKVEKAAARYVQGLTDSSLKSGSFYASKLNVLTGPVVEQSGIFSDLANELYQDNANEAIHRFIS